LTTWSWDYGFYISSTSQNPQLCWDWIKFLSEQTNFSMGVPARKSVAASPAWETAVGKEYAEVYRLAAERVSPWDYSYASVADSPFQTWRGQAVAAALNGEDYTGLLPVLQSKAENYTACISAVDLTKFTSYEEAYKVVNDCARQADPEGDW
jgi:hypothetical protein